MGNRSPTSTDELKVVSVEGDRKTPQTTSNESFGELSPSDSCGECASLTEGHINHSSNVACEKENTEEDNSSYHGSLNSSMESVDIDITMNEDERAEFEEENKNKREKMAILCCGPTGVGKSTLLNGLMGEHKWFHVEKSLRRGTPKVEQETLIKEGIEITVWDTPGLEGGTNDEEYLQEIKRKCAEFDLFLYCIQMTESRCTDLFDEKSSLVQFTNLFGVNKLWKRTVVILTHANSYLADLEEKKEANPEISIDIENKFAEGISKWKKEIRIQVQKLGFKKAKKVPIMPAGIASSPHLPGYEYWLGKIFQKAIDRIDDRARNAYLQVANSRLRQANEVQKEEVAQQKIEDQPFVVTRKFKILTGLASSGVGLAGTATGAGIGATIGALAIGIPTFGVFAAGGLVLGGVIGAGIGLTTSLGTALAIKYFKKRRHRKKYKVSEKV